MVGRVNEARNNEMRSKLVLRGDSVEAWKKIEVDPYNEDSWYQYAMALGNEKGVEESIDAFSQGLFYNPFSALLHFGRGRKNIGLRRYWRAISDFTESIRLHPENWNFWYYRAVSENLNGNTEESISDFMQCFPLTAENEHYPLVDWLFLCNLDLGDKEGAKKALDLIDDNIIPPQMDYAYRRRVQLYKGVIKPEELLDVKHIESHCLPLPGRVNLEIQTLTFGLYAYYEYIGDREKANEVLKTVCGYDPLPAFGYLKGTAIAKERGLID